MADYSCSKDCDCHRHAAMVNDSHPLQLLTTAHVEALALADALAAAVEEWKDYETYLAAVDAARAYLAARG